MVACNYGVVIAVLSEVKSEGTGRTQLGGMGYLPSRRMATQHGRRRRGGKKDKMGDTHLFRALSSRPLRAVSVCL